MGGCVSSAEPERQYSSSTSSAKVVSVKGDLREYPVPMTTVSQVLQMEISSSSSSSSSSSCFVCNSDRLYYDDYIKALEPEEELEADQIYFLLPNTKLQYRLSASDMAALAVKASVALQKATTLNKKLNKRSWRKKKGRISPILFHEADGNHHQIHQKKKNSSKPSAASTSSNGSTGGVSVSRSGSISVRKLQRYSSSSSSTSSTSSTSRRAKLAVRSFRVRLTTIYEGTALHFY